MQNYQRKTRIRNVCERGVSAGLPCCSLTVQRGEMAFFHDAWSEKCEIFRKQKFVFFRCETQKNRELLGATFHSPHTKKNQSSLFIVYKTFTKLVSLAFAVFLMRGAPYRRVRVQEHVPELY